MQALPQREICCRKSWGVVAPPYGGRDGAGDKLGCTAATIEAPKTHSGPGTVKTLRAVPAEGGTGPLGSPHHHLSSRG